MSLRTLALCSVLTSLALTACAEGELDAPSTDAEVDDKKKSDAEKAKTDVCHERKDGSYTIKSVKAKQLAMHLAHGDHLAGTYYPDVDGDGYGDPDGVSAECLEDGYVDDDTDCDDADPTLSPSEPEVCDGIDNNCDGSIDEGFDADADGYTSCAGDCDDTDAAINPGAAEVCDGVDNQCDGDIDEGFDVDADGYTSCDGDCDDANSAINPGAAEVCDGVDNQCDGDIDEGFDVDADGYTSCDGDCDDTDATVSPGASEVCDSTDNDCDGDIDEGFDVDADGYTTCDGDCDDTDAAINPSATETCDGIDNNCDASIDEGFDVDADGYTTCDGDCDDTDATVSPGASEVCDSTDNDCDGDIDEGFDVDADGYTTCDGDCDDTDATVSPGASEVCDSTDNDCDGDIDEGFDVDADGYTTCDGDCDDTDATVSPGASEVCDSTDNDCDGDIDEGFDVDADGYTTCDGDCDDTDAAINPSATETCDGIDNNCDASIDEGFDVDGDAYTTCDGDCDDADTTVYPGAPEQCDGLDNDCDGTIDVGVGVDSDGDGYTACAGDCDDLASDVYPGAAETWWDGTDQDCDGFDGYTIDDLAAGDIVITELMPNPAAVADSAGEWFEITNNFGDDVNLDGLDVYDLGSDSFTVSGTLPLYADDTLVFGKSTALSVNGGADVDYAFGTSMTLANAADEVGLAAGSVVIDEVVWDTTWGFSAGVALGFDPDESLDATNNDDPLYWCEASSAYGDGDLGTPNDLNDTCAVTTYNVGNDTAFSTLGTFGGNYLLGTTISVSGAGTIDEFGFIAPSTAAGDQIRMALYTQSGSSPGSLVAETSATTIVGGSQTIDITDVSLSAGTYYIMAVYDGPSPNIYNSSSGKTVHYAVHTFGSAIPTTWTTTLTFSGQDYNYYLVMY